jgi:Bax protein
VFARINYDFDAVQAGHVSVPRLFVKSLPVDMRRIRAAKERKKLFLLSVLPLILRVNDEIWAERKKLIKLKKLVNNRVKLSAEDRLWLAVMENRYKVTRGDLGALELGMDIIPPSLALAQAAEESGWGTSRFVVEGNALFGQWTDSSKGGLIPLGRVINSNYRIKAFRSLLDGVRAYARNLNTHKAYRSFRTGRSELRRLGLILSGQKLSFHLSPYSERGENYTRSLQKIIKSNSLEKLDGLKLGDRSLRVIQRIIS